MISKRQQGLEVTNGGHDFRTRTPPC
jgi:hypothetical protein